MDKIFYNQASSAKLGWTPEWFGAYEFDEDLLKKIRTFQRLHRLTADGMCGPTTYRRIWTDRESKLSQYEPVQRSGGQKVNHIIYNNDFYPIEWDKVVLPFNAGGKKMTSGYKKITKPRKPKMFVCHWDAALNADSCYRILRKRGLSVHFTIDNDGTIFQYLDMNHIAYHCGGRHNPTTVGVEISNAFYPKYQSWYQKHGFGKRPMVKDAHVHGKPMKPFTDFYPAQVDALKALMKAVHQALEIPLKCPLDSNGDTLYTVDSKASKNRFNGFISHYHISKGKIDCANLDLKALLGEIEDET